MQTVAVLDGKELLGLGNWGNVRVVCIVRPVVHVLEVVLVWLTKVDGVVLGSQLVLLVDAEDRLIYSLALLQSHFFGQRGPHWLFPRQEILFHGSCAVVSFTGFSYSLCSELLQCRIQFSDHRVVVLVRVVAKTKCDIFEVAQRLLSVRLGKCNAITGDKLVKLDGVIRWLTLAICCHYE